MGLDGISQVAGSSEVRGRCQPARQLTHRDTQCADGLKRGPELLHALLLRKIGRGDLHLIDTEGRGFGDKAESAGYRLHCGCVSACEICHTLTEIVKEISLSLIGIG